MPLHDSFSYTARGRLRVPQEWLSEALLYAAYRAGGWRGVMVWRGVFAGALVVLMGLLAVRRRAVPLVALLAVGAGAAISFPEWMARPKIVAPVFAGATLLLLDAHRRGSARAVWAIAPLLWLWANMHASFVFGVFLVFLAAAVAACRAHTRRQGTRLAVAGAAGLALAAFSPGGLRTLINPFQYILGFGASWGVEVFQEWQSPSFHSATGRGIELLLFMLIVGLACGGWRPGAFDLLSLLAVLHLGLTSVRHSALFAVVAAPLAAQAASLAWARAIEAHGPNLRALGERLSALAARLPRAAAWAACLCVSFAALALGFPRSASDQRCLATDELPRAALQRALALHHPGNLFNEYEWGGYIIWDSRGRLPVFVDGRADLYSADLFHEYWTTYNGAPTWRSRFDKYNIGLVLIRRDAPLAYRLEAAPDWRLVYADALAALFARARSNAPRRKP